MDPGVPTARLARQMTQPDMAHAASRMLALPMRLKARIARFAYASTVWSLSAACTIGPATPDAGAAEGGTQLVSDQCNRIVTAFCMRAIGGCGFPDSLSQCIADELPTCCSGSKCNAISQSTPGAVDACTAALSSEDCNSVVTVGPSALAACQGIPQS